ncbi:MAG TPA: tRNA-dihydrouridine synthase [Candidatus Saccharimonadales bacterium]
MLAISKLKKPIFILAPMYDVTDTVFRQIIADLAPPDLFFTEFVNVDGLQSKGRQEIISYLDFSPKEKPIIAQVWGLQPENYFKTVKELSAMGFAGIDINMGCPAKPVVKNGACVALINNRDLAKEIIQATKEGLGEGMSLSVKTRLGFNDIDYTWHEFLLGQDLDMLIVHGRTKKEMSKVPANWEAISEVRKLRDKMSTDTLIIGNGDVMSRVQGNELVNKYELDGVMIGRGIFSDPYIFSESSPWENLSPEEKIKLFKKHIQLFEETWKGTKPTQLLNKFCKVYINNFPRAKEMREKLMNANSTQELLKML